LAEEIRAEASLSIWPEDLELLFPDMMKVLVLMGWIEFCDVVKREW
jgi:hypothetical protein